MRSRWALLPLLAAALPMACLAQDSRRQDLEAFFTRLNEVAQAGDRVGYTGLFWPSAAMFVPNHTPLLGREQIGDWFDDFQASVSLVTDTYEQEQTDIIGDVATVRSHGTGDYVVRATGERLRFDQKYVDILRYSDGQWFMIYHVASSSINQAGLWNRAFSQDFGSGDSSTR